MRYIAISCLLLMLAGAVFAADQPAKISLELKDADMSQALLSLSKASQITVLGDASAKGTVNCTLSDVTTEQALDTICKMNKLSWLKVYISPGQNERLNAARVLAVVDALKKLGGKAIVVEDPTAETRTVFVPAAKPDDIETSSIVTSMKLKPVYLVRAEPDPNAEAEKKVAAPTNQSSGLSQIPPADVQAAAQQVWNYFNQMPPEQRFDVMREMRRMMMENITPEQREEMRRRFEQRRQDGQGPGGPGLGGPRPNGSGQGYHQHRN